jgi:tetratricopeptide (TPR) repeat protein
MKTINKLLIIGAGLLSLNSTDNLEAKTEFPQTDANSIRTFHHTIDIADSIKNTGNYPAAIETYQKALNYSTGGTFFESYAYSTLGFLHGKLGNNAAAIRNHQEAYNLQPDIPAFSNNLAFVYAKSDTLLEEALNLAKVLPMAEPLNHMGWSTLAYVETKLNQDEEALKHYENAIALSENDPNLKIEDIMSYHQNISIVLTKLGKTEEAKKHEAIAKTLGSQE